MRRILLGIGLLVLWVGVGWAQGRVLKPGLYTAGEKCWARVGQMQGGAVAIALWQGTREGLQSGGFMLVGTLLPAPGGRLVGTFQASPRGCCLLRGRWEVKVMGEREFAFSLLVPSQGARAWGGLEGMVFRLVEERQPMGLEGLVGRWRMRYCYRLKAAGRDVLDTAEAMVVLEKGEGQGLTGRWEGAGGKLRVVNSGGLVELSYDDPAQDFSLEATLSQVGGGLGLVGPMHSVLGSGTMVLVREGLPAMPPGCERRQQGELTGLWVDERTGDDFFEITGSAKGFSFIHYGGSRTHPRYLSKGRAVAQGGGQLVADVADAPGYCCGNQGRMAFRVLGPDLMEVRSAWWPRGAKPSRIELSAPYRIRRVGGAGPAGEAQVGIGQMVPARPGLPGITQGSVRAVVTYRPPTPPRICTIFSQGGYRRWLELLVDAQGRPGARISTVEGEIVLSAQKPLSPQGEHELWLIYNQGGRARLVVDGKEVASQPMNSPRAGSGGVYVIGASRQPGRTYSGEIRLLQLWSTAQDPASPAPPQMALGPVGPAQQQPAPLSQPSTSTLWRLWHPGRLVHAYTSDPQQLKRLKAEGFEEQGPVCRLLKKPAPGAVELRVFEAPEGWQVLAPQSPGTGFRSLGVAGYAYKEPAKGAVKLLELTGKLADPFRGGPRKDVVYTTHLEQLGLMAKVGYTRKRVVGWVLPAQEPALHAPVLYTWAGAWRGEGWGKFFILRRGRQLMMFWYYADFSGPHYFGRYRLDPGGTTARGMAVGRPGPRASYYRQQLMLQLNNPAGPRIKVISWRVAAPLDDGRLVHFNDPQPTTELLIKTSQDIPSREMAQLRAFAQGPDPSEMFEQALSRAKAEGRVVER